VWGGERGDFVKEYPESILRSFNKRLMHISTAQKKFLAHSMS